MEGIPPPPWKVVEAAVRCGRELVTRVDRDLADLGLSWGQFQALAVVVEQRGWIHAGAVGRRMGVSRQSAHALLRRLDARGFLTWKDEGWIRSARPTAEGEEALREAYGRLEDVFAAIARLTIQERKMVVSAEHSIHRELLRPARRPQWYEEYLPEERRGEPRGEPSTR